MVARSLAKSRRVLVQCLYGDGLVEWGDVGVGMVLYKSGVVLLGGAMVNKILDVA